MSNYSSYTSQPVEQPAPSGGRHPVNIGHLVMGLAFLGLVGVWAVVTGDVVDDEDIRWLLPVPWVLAGVGGLVALAVTGARRHAVTATGWVDTPTRADDTSEPDPLDHLDEQTDTDPKPDDQP